MAGFYDEAIKIEAPGIYEIEQVRISTPGEYCLIEIYTRCKWHKAPNAVKRLLEKIIELTEGVYDMDIVMTVIKVEEGKVFARVENIDLTWTLAPFTNDYITNKVDPNVIVSEL